MSADDAGTGRPRPRRGRPPATSAEAILAAARRLIAREGWDRLTIRGLARDLGVGPATIYHHVRDREDLLVQLISEDAAQAPRPELPADPRERIIAIAITLRDVLRDLPWAAEVLTVDGFVGRLSDDALWFVEAILEGARACGCSTAQAVELFRNLWYLTVGEILVRAHSADAGRTGIDRARLLDETAAPFRDRDDSTVPHLAEIGPQWPALAAQDSFPQGVRALVNGTLAHLD